MTSSILRDGHHEHLLVAVELLVGLKCRSGVENFEQLELDDGRRIKRPTILSRVPVNNVEPRTQTSTHNGAPISWTAGRAVKRTRGKQCVTVSGPLDTSPRGKRHTRSAVFWRAQPISNTHVHIPTRSRCRGRHGDTWARRCQTIHNKEPPARSRIQGHSTGM